MFFKTGLQIVVVFTQPDDFQNGNRKDSRNMDIVSPDD